MASFIANYFDNFSNALGNPNGNLGDFAHASALYIRNNLRLAPKVKFLYHVVFDVNRTALLELGIYDQLQKNEFNLLVESASMPSYTFDTSTLNMYNRKKVVQTKVNYDPVEFVFHDDNAGLTTLLWESYFRWYYQDPNYANTTSNGQPNTSVPLPYNNSPVDHYKGEFANTYNHGLDRRKFNNVPFFNSITINQLHSTNVNNVYTSMTLVNPLIETFAHDRVEQSASNFMTNTMRVAYESVLYGRGTTSQDNPSGFANPSHYDVTPSPLTVEGGGGRITNIFGRGGLVDGFTSIFRDIETGRFDLGTIATIKNTIELANNLEFDNVGDIINSAEGQGIQAGILDQLIFGAINSTFPNSNSSSAITNTTVSSYSSQTSTLSRRERLNALQNNQGLLDEVSFQVFRDDVGTSNSGNIQDMKDIWNSLSPIGKEQYYQSALDQA